VKVNQSKLAHVTFTTLAITCLQIYKDDAPIPTKNEAKCLELHLEQRLTCYRTLWWTGDSWVSNYDKCIGWGETNPLCRQITKFFSTKSSLNKHGQNCTQLWKCAQPS